MMRWPATAVGRRGVRLADDIAPPVALFILARERKICGRPDAARRCLPMARRRCRVRELWGRPDVIVASTAARAPVCGVVRCPRRSDSAADAHPLRFPSRRAAAAGSC